MYILNLKQFDAPQKSLLYCQEPPCLPIAPFPEILSNRTPVFIRRGIDIHSTKVNKECFKRTTTLTTQDKQQQK